MDTLPCTFQSAGEQTSKRKCCGALQTGLIDSKKGSVPNGA